MTCKIYIVPYLPEGLGQKITFSSKKQVDHVTMSIVNSIPDTN